VQERRYSWGAGAVTGVSVVLPFFGSFSFPVYFAGVSVLGKQPENNGVSKPVHVGFFATILRDFKD
jgi:hypothetical protein